MKTNLLTQSIKAFSLMLLLSTLNSRLSTAFAQGTGFTYQGRLVQNGAPANGSYSFQFLLRQTSNGAALTGVNAATLDGFNSSGFWKIGGNSGATAGVNFIGTTDNQPLELKVNGGRALRIEPNTNGAPNIIGGSRNNFVAPDISGATIAGGGAEYYYGVSLTNSITRDFGTVGGGAGNTADYFAIVAGG